MTRDAVSVRGTARAYLPWSRHLLRPQSAATCVGVGGGQVRITADTVDGKAVLSVTNTGPVIPDTEIDRLFRPFQRLDPRRTHQKSGLGTYG